MNAQAIQSLRDALFEAENLTDDFEGVAYEVFENSRQSIRLTERSLEIVGEAIRRALHAEPGLQDSYPETREWIALRNVLSHQYERVLPSTPWSTAKDDLPDLTEQLRRLLEPLGSS